MPGMPPGPPGFPMTGPPPPGLAGRPPPGAPYPGQFQYPGMPPGATSIMPAAYSHFYQPRPPQVLGGPPHPGQGPPPPGLPPPMAPGSSSIPQPGHVAGALPPASGTSPSPSTGIASAQLNLGLKNTSHITSSPDPTTLAAAIPSSSAAAAATNPSAPAANSSSAVVSSAATVSATATTTAPAPAETPKAAVIANGAPTKKESVLVYTNNDVSVEEVRASLERYRFKPQVESAA
ncbi:hypothetical protein BGW38_005611 [Lunasporangiospora selenospora]|uniref:Uncharacterized protein n=1 Tax=Lunasporangiospora selenospora TaxID=979761 RepID=A0A9P6FN80_9FUNG|nr:hypothetical protein BGW38_005611 [Lunasporangiospora selenospora]